MSVTPRLYSHKVPNTTPTHVRWIRWLATIAAVLGLFSPAWAEPGEAVPRTVYQLMLPVYVEEPAPGNVPAALVGGKSLGVVEGGRGTLWRVGEDDIFEIGTVDVRAVQDEASAAILRIMPDWEARTGDLATVPVRFPTQAHDTLGFRMATHLVFFRGLDEQPIETIADYFDDPNRTDDSALIAAALEVIHAHAPQAASHTVRVEGGRYDGMTLSEAMAAATEVDVRRFFQYVTSFPNRYVARNFRVSESYAAWVNSSGLESPLELYELLEAADPAQHRPMLVQRVDQMREEDFVGNWYNEAYRIMYSDPETALRIADYMTLAAAVIGDPRERYLAASLRADALDNNGRLDEAVEAYEYGLSVARNAEDEAILLNNASTVYRKLGRYEEALDRSVRAAELRGKESGGEQKFHEAFPRLGAAIALRMLERHTDALEESQRAEKLARGVMDLRGVEIEGSALLEQGRALQSLGRYEEAIEVRRRAVAVARELQWSQEAMDALAAVGSSLWDLSRYAEALDAYRECLELANSLENTQSAGFYLTNIGSLEWTVGRMDEATEAFEAALALHRADGDHANAADVLRRQAGMERDRGRLAVAEDLVTRGLALLDDNGLQTGHDPLDEEYAEILNASGRSAEASDAYGRALQRPGLSRARQAALRTAWSWVLVQAHDPDRGMDELERALVLVDEIGDRAGEGRSRRFLAELQLAFEGGTEEAAENAVNAVEIARALPSPELEAEALVTRARVEFALGQPSAAMDSLGEARTLALELGNAQVEIRALLALGQVQEAWGDYDTAIDLYEQALELARGSELASLEAQALESRGWVWLRLARYVAAEADARAALAIRTDLEDEWGSTSAWNTLAAIEHDRGNMALSVEYYTRKLEISRRWKDGYGESGGLINIAGVYLDQGDWSQALAFLDDAITIGDRLEDTELIVIGNVRRALSLSKLGRPDEALSALEEPSRRARAEGHVPKAIWADQLRGRLLREAGQLEEAISVLEAVEAEATAAELGRVAGGVRAEWGEALMMVGRSEEGVAALASAVETLRVHGAPIALWEPLYWLGKARRASGDSDGAVAALQESVDLIERLKGGLVGGPEAADLLQADRDGVYQELVDLYTELERKDDAWKILGLAKSRELRNFAGELQVTAEEKAALDEGERLLAAERTLVRQLSEELSMPTSRQRPELVARWRNEVDRMQLAFDDFTRKLATEHEDLYQRVQIEPPNFFRLQQALDIDECFIEPAVLPDRIVTFVVCGGDRPLVYREVEVEESEVNALVHQMRAKIANPLVPWRGLGAKPGASEAAQRLHALLIAPIAGDLEGIETLVLSPSGRLRYLPFAALFDGETFLVERYETAVLTMAGAIGAARPMPRRSRVLAFGDPDGSLAGARREVEELARSIPRVSTYVGPQATWETLRAEVPHHGVLHLATHGVLRDDKPVESFLLLAGDDQSQLNFRTIPLLDLRDVELAVLSACESALGDRGEGSEIAGMAYQFEMRGASSVVASLWLVHDQSTASLMTSFYGQLKKRRTTRAEAIRAAQMSMLASEDFDHPHHWAAFLLIGDWH